MNFKKKIVIINRAIQSLSNKEKYFIKCLLFISLLGIIYIIASTTLTNNNFVIAEEGGSYSEGVVGEQLILNPVYTDYSNVDRDLARLLFSGLLKFDPEQNTMIPDIGDYKVLEGNTLYEFTLKDNVYFHDGVKLTAQDILFTYVDIIQSPDFNNQFLSSIFTDVEVYESNNKIYFKLDSPNTFFLANLGIGILPFHLYKDVPVLELEKSIHNYKPIGSGPYKMVERMQNKVSLKSFDKFYGEKAYINDIDFHIYSSEDNLFNHVNKINVTPKLTGEFYEKYKTLQDYDFIPYSLPQYTALFLNNQNEYLKNKKIRKAISLAIDKNKIKQTLQHVDIVDSPLLELEKKKYIHEFSVGESRRLLESVGFKLESTSPDNFYLTNEDGQELSLTLVYRVFESSKYKNDIIQKTVDIIVEQLKDVGIDVVTKGRTLSELNQIIPQRNYDLLLYGQNIGSNLDTFSYWHSSQTDELGLNLSNYKSFNADALIDNIRTTFNPEFKQKLLEELESVLMEDIAAVTLFRPIYYYAKDTRLRNIKLENLVMPSDRFSNISKWYIKGKKL